MRTSAIILGLVLMNGGVFAADFNDLAVTAGQLQNSAEWNVTVPLARAAVQPELRRVRRILARGGAIPRESAAFMETWFPKFLAAGQLGRLPTTYEKAGVQGWFPKLAEKGDWRVTGEACPTYSCVSWAVGVTTEWLWPGQETEDFEEFFPEYGYLQLPYDAPETSADIAYMEGARGGTHASRRVAGDIWESKLGSSLRVLHRLYELEGSQYGHVVRFYRKGTPAELAALGIKPKAPTASAADPCVQRAPADRGGAYDLGSPLSDLGR